MKYTGWSEDGTRQFWKNGGKGWLVIHEHMSVPLRGEEKKQLSSLRRCLAGVPYLERSDEWAARDFA